MENRKSEWSLLKHDVPGRNIVLTEASGKATAKAVQELTAYVVEKGKNFKGKWAYAPNIEKLDPVEQPETQQAFAELHKKCEEAGCAAMAFISGGLAAIKVQAKRHQRTAQTGKMIEEYFSTKEEALEWLKSIGI